MTPEIEKLRTAWGEARAAVESAKLAEEAARKSLDTAIAAWATADLQARGIAIGVTPVEYATHRPYEGRPMHFGTYNGPCAVIAVRGSHGMPLYSIKLLTKTGALSQAKGAYSAQAYAVRLWGSK